MRSHARKIHVLGAASVFPALLSSFDFVSSFMCNRVPLSWYLAACMIGVVVGPALGTRLHGSGDVPRLLRRLVSVTVVFGMLAASYMALATPATAGAGFPPSWSSECAWRYCARALGSSLGRSPFPVGQPSCDALQMCANEYPYSHDEQGQLLTLMRTQGCAAP